MAQSSGSFRVFPFRYKLTLLISGIVILVLGSIFLVVRSYIEAEFRELVLRQLDQTHRYVTEKMTSRHQHLRASALGLSDDRLVLDVLTDHTLSELTRNDIVAEEILPGLVDVDLLAVVDDGGSVVAHNLDAELDRDVLLALRQAPWFAPLLRGEPVTGYVFVDGTFAQVVGLPVFIGEEMVGGVLAGRQLTGEQLLQIKETTGADIAVLEAGALELSTLGTWSRDPDALAAYLAAFERWLDSQTAALARSEGPDGAGAREAQEVPLRDERFLLRLVRDPGGFVPPYVVLQSLDERLEFLGDLQLTTFAIGGVGVGAGIALGFLMALAVSRPIRLLRTATHEVERDNLAHRVSIRTRDEFAQLGRAFNTMIEGLAEKKRIRSAFDKSVSREVADHILGADAHLGGERRRATILFSDVRDFTTLAEKLEPEALIGLLNAYFTRTNGCILSHHGITDKFIGDAVMALFGAPIPREQHALDAVRAAQDMLGALEIFNREVASRYDCQLEVGVGINTGDVVAGLVGSEDRLAYTAVGDDVNLASRLEGLCAAYGARIVLGESTFQELQRASADALAEMAVRELDRVRVKGKSAAVRIYELLYRSEPVSELGPQLELFQEARRCLLRADFEGARIHLDSVLAAWPRDGGARSLRARCERYAAEPELFLREYDDGIRVLTSK